MQAIRNILIVIDPARPEMLALQRGRMIAGRSRPGTDKPKLRLLVCDERTDHTLLLNRLQSSLSLEGLDACTQQAWHGSLHQTVAIAQQANDCDLVIKQHQADSPLKKALFTPEDWKLMRYCPAPTLMVKTDATWDGGKILAALDLGNSERQHHVLQESILRYSKAFAELTQSELHAIYARPSPLVSATAPGFQLERQREQELPKSKLRALQERYGVASEHLHTPEGAADIAIPQLASQLHATLTVIGTVARMGLSGALIGNTAEIVLDALESDVLVIKPERVIEALREMLSHT